MLLSAIRSAAIIFFCPFLLPCHSAAYGHEGHEIVGAIADQLIKGTHAEVEVKALLHGESLSEAATWADRAKSKKGLTDEMNSFVHSNPKHHNFHYTDVPFQESKYKEHTAGTEDFDIVHSIRACIEILQNGKTTNSCFHDITQREALMLLAHYVGDIHQPLHVGAAYIDLKDKFVNPNDGFEGQEDHGGNYLKYGSSSLHSYWDDNTVSRVMTKAKAGTPQECAAHLIRRARIPKTGGDVISWSQQWADEILSVARQAHSNFRVGKKTTVTDFFGTHPQWTVTAPKGYTTWARDVVEVELARAGFRLAEVLKTIWPSK